MASIDKRIRDGQVTWLARWRDPAGRQRKRMFPRKADAERFLTTVNTPCSPAATSTRAGPG